eukprot:tig00000241_g20903.t1
MQHVAAPSTPTRRVEVSASAGSGSAVKRQRRPGQCVRAPELPSDKTLWINTDEPVQLAELRRKAGAPLVLLDFWTLGCINCQQALPDVRYLEEKYGPEELLVVGVHSGKFDREKQAETVRDAVLRLGITHPVLVDSRFLVWNKYGIRAWPSFVVIDPEGYVVGFTSGEGNRELLDETIAKTLAEHRGTDPAVYAARPLKYPGKVVAVGGGGVRGGGLLLVADTGHHRLVVADPEGRPLLTVGSGLPGFHDGPAEEARFTAPQGIAYEAEGHCAFVCDTGNHAVRRVDLATGEVTTVAGTGRRGGKPRAPPGPDEDEAAAWRAARELDIPSPWDAALAGGTLYVAAAGSHQVFALDVAAGRARPFAGAGFEACVDGPAHEAGFAQPSGLAWDEATASLYVADAEASSLRAVSLAPPGPSVRLLAGSGGLFGFGLEDGAGSNARLQHCSGVALAGNTLLVADSYNNAIRQVDPATGACETLALPAGSAPLSEPGGLSFDPASSLLYVCDTNAGRLRRFSAARREGAPGWRLLAELPIDFPGLCSPPGSGPGAVCYPPAL